MPGVSAGAPGLGRSTFSSTVRQVRALEDGKRGRLDEAQRASGTLAFVVRATRAACRSQVRLLGA